MTTSPTMQLLKKKQQKGEIKDTPEQTMIEDHLDAPEAPEPQDILVADEQITEADVKPKKASKSKSKKEIKPDAEGTEVEADLGNIKTLSQSGDLLSDTIHSIESLADELDAIKLAHELHDKGEFYDFALGGVLSKIQAEGWITGHESFKAFIEKEFGFKYRKAIYLTNIYNCLASLGLPHSTFAGVGWKKMGMLSNVLTVENHQEWIKTAKELTVVELQDYLIALAKSDSTPEEAKATATSLKSKNFKLHEDQVEMVDDALALAKEKGNTEYDAVALEYICAEFLGGGAVVAPKKDTSKSEPSVFDPSTADIASLRSQLLAAVQAQHGASKGDQITEYIGDLPDLYPEYTFDVNEA